MTAAVVTALFCVLSAGVVSVGAANTLRLRRGHRRRGESMLPAFSPGDRLVHRGSAGPVEGVVAVVGEPDPETGWRASVPSDGRLAGGWYIKRVVATAGTRYPVEVGVRGTVPPGHLALLGDHASSSGSRAHGPCPEHQVLGVVVRRLVPGPGNPG